MKDKDKKIALVTCYFQPNYGSQLQAYATQRIFDELGVDNETICIDGLRDEINAAKMRYFLNRMFDSNTVKDKWATVKKKMAQKLHKEYAANLEVRNAKFRDYASERFRLSKRYDSKAQLSAEAARYAAFVVGSDQLWLPSNIEADYYTLNFVPKGIPRIALATSFGISRLPRRQAAKATAFLPKFNALSLREKSGQKIVNELTGIEAPVVCDPTILFTADQWSENIPKERFVKDKYIFCYFLGNNPCQRQWVKKVAEKTGLKIVQLAHCDEYIKSDVGFADETPYNVGPDEFIRLIRDAEYVMTDSFHCTVFSLLFAKRFFTFRRYNNDGIVSTNNRLYSLLSTVNAEDRLMRGDEDIEEALSKSPDFKTIHAELDSLRNFTVDFIKKALDDNNLR